MEMTTIATRGARWRMAYRVLSRGFFPLRRLCGRPHHDSILVVMCLWNRPERIESIVRLITEQDSSAPVRLVLWNNDWRQGRAYVRRIRASWPADSRHSVEFFNSPMNMGGVARFFVARKLRRPVQSQPFIMLDDDQDVQPTFVSDIMAQWVPRSIWGFWAWRIHGSYFNRTPPESGALADYVGTGACICDASIIDDRRFFAGLPTEYAFIEDLWMSRYAAELGWDLRKADVEVDFVLDETNQNHHLSSLKDEFYQLLQAQAAARTSPSASEQSPQA